MALRLGGMYYEIGSQTWRHNRGDEWADLSFVSSCCENTVYYTVRNESSKQLESLGIKTGNKNLFVSQGIVCMR